MIVKHKVIVKQSKRRQRVLTLTRVLLGCVALTTLAPFVLKQPKQANNIYFWSNTERRNGYDKPAADGDAKYHQRDNVKESSATRKGNVEAFQRDNRKKPPKQSNREVGPPTTYWASSRGIVHVIYSRFMQHQPDLVELGLARLELFKTFCLPTITQQTNQEFLWIIRTDPELHPTLKDSLIQAIDGLTNVAIVGSNEIRKGSIKGGFRGSNAISDILPESLFYGKMILIKSFHNSAQTHTVLETNLDMDDGLGLGFVETAQNITHYAFHGNRRRNAWMNLCVGRHLEWQYYAPWDNATDKGSLTFGSTHICVTAGLSWATMVKAEPEFVEAHHLVKRESRDCRVFHKTHVGCWKELPEDDLLAIRARTPTSTGMARVLSSDSEWTKEQLDTDIGLWSTLHQSFGITKASIRTSHRYLSEHMEVVVQDNLKGQCRKDHSCSEGIKKKLKRIIFKGDMYKNKHDLVHVIQTSLDSPLSAEVLSLFCFGSLEAQTSYEFLWIIRVQAFSDSDDMETLVTSMIEGKSPLNILVVKSDQTSTMDFRNPQAIADITEDTLLYGEMSMLEDFHRAAQNRTLLETSLEPYEALSKTFVEELQASTVSQLEESQVMDEDNTWYYRCGAMNIKWNYFTPQGYDVDSGFLSLVGPQGGKCMDNPAVTRISLPGAKIPYFNEESEVHKCQVLVVLRIHSGCHAPMMSNETLTARALIPESVEKPVPLELSDTEFEVLRENDQHLRGVLRDDLNIFPSAVEKMRSHIQKTQCSDSLTCNAKWDSEHGVTHVIQTYLHDPSVFTFWRHFCLSLESQTTNKFLWIIRVGSDPSMIDQVLKTVHNIPLNVVIVKSSSASRIPFSKAESISGISNETLVYGDMTMLEYFHLSAQRRPLLETFLEPTEALSKGYIASLQKSSAMEIKAQTIVHGKNAWYYRCVSEYIGWSYLTASGSSKDVGSFEVISPGVSKCLDSPGTTRISLPGSEIPTVDDTAASGRACVDRSYHSGCLVPLMSGAQAVRVMTAIPSPRTGSTTGSDPLSLFEQQQKFKVTLRDGFGIFPIALRLIRSKSTDIGGSVSQTEWHNDRNVVHVVYTRFMQQQGTLLHLGDARLELFKTLCLPTITQQINKQFLWIIRTDPELDPVLKEGLLEAVSGMPNTVVLASDLFADGHHGGSLRKTEAMAEFNAQAVWHGDVNLVRSYHEASKEHALLETNLDADDGIALTFVEYVQDMTVATFQNDRDGVGWFQICLGRHLEWHFYAPWEKKSDKGCLLVGSKRTCLKSGISWATQPKSAPMFMRDLKLLKDDIPSCSFNRTDVDRLYEGCWDEVKQQDPVNDVLAIRTMSPASSGVARGEISSFDWNIKVLLYDRVAWTLLDPYFTIHPESVKTIRKDLAENRQAVLEDNERSKCTHDKTCAGKWTNSRRVVHVIHTSLNDPNLVELLYRVTLSSLTRQSSYEFLWIIRIADFSDYRLLLKLLDPIRMSPFLDNIILVKSEAVPVPDFRSSAAIADISEERIVHGDITILNDYHKASQTRPLLETFLQPTDGVGRMFIEEIQDSIVAQLEAEKMASGENSWYYRCIEEHMELDYISPRGTIAEDGFLFVVGQHGSHCMDKPGTTRVTLPGSMISSEQGIAQECESGWVNNGCFVPIGSVKPLGLRVVLDSAREPTQFSQNEIATLEAQQSRFRMQQRLFYSVFPPNRETLKEVMEENKNPIVHIVHTWVHQPLSSITWRQFCANAVFGQTSQKFLWIIRADSADTQLFNSISHPLRDFFKEPRNVFLVRSKNTPTVSFRFPEAIADITEDTLVRGKMEDLLDAHMAAKGRTVIETFLQPTDSLVEGFVANLQESVRSEIQESEIQGHHIIQSHAIDQDNAWYYRCSPEYIQWSYFSPRGDKTKTGFLTLVDGHHSRCYENPAVTRISFPGSEMTDGMVVSDAEKCTSERRRGCYAPFVAETTQAARALIPESVLQAPHSEISEMAMTQFAEQHERLLTVFSNSFNTGRYNLEILVNWFYKSKCGEGGACTSKWASEFGVVHVVYTSVQDPMMVNVWRKFCFGLEAQTTTKFLWIIRASSDMNLLKEVAKPSIKTPLNIIVARSNYTPTVDFRHRQAIHDLNNATVLMLTGMEMEALNYFHDMAQSLPLLETFLQPTDALAKNFVVNVQNSTMLQIKENSLQKRKRSWYYRCISQPYIEWKYRTPRGEDSEVGFMELVNPKNVTCLHRPGTTRVSLPGAEIPVGTQQSDSPLCSTVDENENGCYMPITAEEAIAARVVIPDSINGTL
eukprot:scaffold22666_cov142-Cylindrotheca_fusiformis.AAC.1